MIKENNNTNQNPTSLPTQINLLNLTDDSCNCLFCLADLIIPYNGKLILYFKKSTNINGIVDKFILASPINEMRNYNTVIV